MIDGAVARSWLFTPGDRPERFDTRHTRAADVTLLDLEDAVAPDGKETARRAVAEYLRTGSARVRVNGADTPEWADDVAAPAGPEAFA